MYFSKYFDFIKRYTAPLFFLCALTVCKTNVCYAEHLHTHVLQKATIVTEQRQKMTLEVVTHAPKESDQTWFQAVFDVPQMGYTNSLQPITLGHSFLLLKDQKGHILSQLKYSNPGTFFKVYHLPGLPFPLISVINIIDGGGNHTEYTLFVYTIQNHHLKTLIKAMIAPTEMQSKWVAVTGIDGFYLGQLPDHSGVGITYYSLDSHGNEAYADPHPFFFKLYRWNGQKFICTKSFLTKHAYGTEKQAGQQEFGFDFKNAHEVIKAFPMIPD